MRPDSTLGGRGAVSFPEPDRLATITSHGAGGVTDVERVTNHQNQEGLHGGGGLGGEGCIAGSPQGKEAAETESQIIGREGRGGRLQPGIIGGGVAWRTTPMGAPPNTVVTHLGCRSGPTPCPGQPEQGAHSGGTAGSKVRVIQKGSWQPLQAGQGRGQTPRHVSLPLHMGLLKLQMALVWRKHLPSPICHRLGGRTVSMRALARP